MTKWLIWKKKLYRIRFFVEWILNEFHIPGPGTHRLNSDLFSATIPREIVFFSFVVAMNVNDVIASLSFLNNQQKYISACVCVCVSRVSYSYRKKTTQVSRYKTTSMIQDIESVWLAIRLNWKKIYIFFSCLTMTWIEQLFLSHWPNYLAKSYLTPSSSSSLLLSQYITDRLVTYA